MIVKQAGGGNTALLALALAGALWLYSRDSWAQTVYDDGSTEIPPADLPAPDYGVLDPAPTGYPVEAIIAPDMPASMLDAFRFMIRSCEHNASDVADDSCYYTFYGRAQFYDLSNHPVLTGELKGVPLPAQMCINAGIKSGNCVSTAAGAYQINVPTWNEVLNYDGPTLESFSFEMQDEACRRILRKIGALDLVYAGDIFGAIQKAGKRWASIPGAVGKQGQRTLDFCIARFNEYMQGVGY